MATTQTLSTLASTIASIVPEDQNAIGQARQHQLRLTKPAASLGLLEHTGNQLAGIAGVCPPPVPTRVAVTIFAGDHGVYAQGVSPWPQSVTSQMALNIASGGAGCSVLARQVGAELYVVNVGTIDVLPAHPRITERRVAAGTRDFTAGPAMTVAEARAAVEVGMTTAIEQVEAGYHLLTAGEVGIGNTTPAAALVGAFTRGTAEQVTGRGAASNPEMLARKTDIVRRGLDLHQCDPSQPLEVLAAVGGLEHAAMAGYYLGAASRRVPVILDGVIAASAALAAVALCPEVRGYLIPGHRSAEPGSRRALEHLELRPLVDLDLCLGEATGALLAVPLVQAAARVLAEMATFDGAGVDERLD